MNIRQLEEIHFWSPSTPNSLPITLLLKIRLGILVNIANHPVSPPTTLIPAPFPDDRGLEWLGF